MLEMDWNDDWKSEPGSIGSDRCPKETHLILPGQEQLQYRVISVFSRAIQQHYLMCHANAAPLGKCNVLVDEESHEWHIISVIHMPHPL